MMKYDDHYLHVCKLIPIHHNSLWLLIQIRLCIFLFQVFKPFAICMFMMFFLQMSGFNVMVFYCVTIFQTAGSTIDPNVSSIIVGVVLLVSCFVALGVVSQLGRKVILVLSIFGMSVCHMSLGACFYLKEQSDMTNTTTASPAEPENSVLGWLPLVSVIGFLFLGNIGYGTLIWVVTAELLPPKVRKYLTVTHRTIKLTSACFRSAPWPTHSLFASHSSLVSSSQKPSSI